MVSRRTLVRFVLLALASSGCNSSSGLNASEFREDFDRVLTLRPGGDEVALPELEPPLSAEETRALRDSFSWADADEIAETDAEGRPALYYALVYLQSQDDVELLELTGAHHSGIPLFEEERDRWRGQAGFFMFEGDGEGVFRFAIIPGFFFNAMRQAALDGESVFRAVVLRDAPSQFTLPDGSLSYEALGEQGFVYGGGADQPADSPDGPQDPVAGQVQPILNEIIRGVANAVEGVVQGVRQAVGELDEAAAGSAIVRVSVRPINTDRGFEPGSWMRRAWGDAVSDNGIPTFGAPMWIRGAHIEAHKGVSLARARLDGWGVARLEVPKGQQTLCLELGNDAADISSLVTELSLCTFQDQTREEFDQDFQRDTTVVMDVQDPRVNMFAQFQDGQDYMNWVAGYRPRQVRVQVGDQADFIGDLNGRRAVAFCLGDPRNPFRLILPVLIPDLLRVGFVDIVMPNFRRPSGTSRGVPTHEYGHHVLCDLMISNNIAKFGEAWINVVINTFGDQSPGADADTLYTNEAFADFFALQVVGGTNYPTLHGAKLASQVGYCPVSPEIAAQNCAEDNVGGGAEAEQDYDGLADTVLNPDDFDDDTPYQQQVAKVVTLFHDAFDGSQGISDAGLVAPSSGAAFGAGPSGLLGDPVRARTDAILPSGARGDEVIKLPGSAILRFVSVLFDQWASISEANFYNALALTVLEHGYTTNETCALFALHVESGDCTDVLHPSVLSGEDLVPGSVLGFTVETDTETGDVTFSWRRNSRFATGYELVLTPESGAARTIAFENDEVVTHVERDLPGDTLHTASVVTVNGSNRSDPVLQEFVTLADLVDSVSVLPGRGRIDVTWLPPASGRLRAYELWQLAPDGRLLDVTTDTSFRVSGLSDAFEYQFGVRTLNQVDETGRFVQSARVRPLPSLIVHVAVLGNDDAPGAGSPTTPFAHLGAALVRAAAIDADIIRMAEGVYQEAGPLAITHTVRIEGGFDGSAWTAGAGPTRVEVPGVNTGLLAPQSERFNVRGQSAHAAVAIAGGQDVTIVDIEMAAVGSTLPRTHCTGVIQVAGSGLTLQRATVRLERPSSTLACVGGVFAVPGTGLDPRVSIFDSDIAGYGYEGLTAVPDGMELAGVAVQGAEDLIVDGSAIAALKAPSLAFLAGNLSAAGLATSGVDVIQLRESDFLAIAEPASARVLGAGALTGAELEASASIDVDDSVFQTPTGGTNNNALDVKSSPGGLGTVNLVHITAVVGRDWDLSRSSQEPFAGAALRLVGSMEVVHVVNSILSFASGVTDTASVRYTGVDISDRDTLPVEFAFQGNMISTPAWQWKPNAEGSLVYCLPRSVSEFANAYTEQDLQDSIGYTCGGSVPDSSRWNTGNNIALTEAPDPNRDDLSSSLPWCAAFGIDGNPEGYASKALPELSSPPLSSSGVVLGSLPYVVEAPRDRGGATRNRSAREAAGAWLP